MDPPSNVAQFVALVVVVLPGVTYATVRNRARGLGAASIGTGLKIGEGIAAGVVFDVFYVLVFGNAVISAFTIKNGTVPSPRTAAAYALLLGMLVPALAAWLLHRGSRWTRPEAGPLGRAAEALARWRVGASQWTRQYVGAVVPAFSTVPTAWDFTLPGHGGSFVRIECANGKYLGGWFAEQSFVSTYPEPHDIYVEVQWHMNADGSFGKRVEGSDGFWYAMQPGDLIEWVKQGPTADAHSTEHEGGTQDD